MRSAWGTKLGHQQGRLGPGSASASNLKMGNRDEAGGPVAVCAAGAPLRMLDRQPTSSHGILVSSADMVASFEQTPVMQSNQEQVGTPVSEYVSRSSYR